MKTKYNIGDTVWYIKRDEVQEFEIVWIAYEGDIEDPIDWYYLTDLDYPMWHYRLSIQEEIFETEREAKDDLIKIFEAKINNLKQ